MKIHLLSLLVGTAVATIGVAQASEPIGLSERQLDQVTAGSLTVFTTGDVLANLADLQRSGSLTPSVLADVQAFLNQIQTALAELQRSGSLTPSVLADVQASLNQIQTAQVTGANIIRNLDGYTFTTTSAPAFLGIGGVPVPITIFAF